MVQPKKQKKTDRTKNTERHKRILIQCKTKNAIKHTQNTEGTNKQK